MITHELHRDEGILVVTPAGPLESADFDGLAREVDPYLEENGRLHGLMIYTESFPGWDGFAGLVSHLRFVKDHHERIEKVAAVTDSGFLSIVPRVANHFIKAEIRHFDYADRDAAFTWLRRGP